MKIPFSFLKTVILASALLPGSYSVFSQNMDSKKEGSLTISADSRLDSLIQIHKRTNEEKQTMPGYRVQLFFGTDRKKANDIRSGFLQKHSEVSAYVIYQQPNYKVRAGDFRTRLEANRLLQKITLEFPSAFLVKDEIALPPLE